MDCVAARMGSLSRLRTSRRRRCLSIILPDRRPSRSVFIFSIALIRKGVLHVSAFLVTCHWSLYLKQKRDGPFGPPLPAYELLLSSCFGKSMCGLVLGDHFVEFEDGQEHGDHDAADDHA